jgi:uncharacterized membrane protein
MNFMTTSGEDAPAVSKTRRWLLIGFPLLLLAAFLALPWPLMEKLRAIGHTVCMLRPSHSHFLAGEQLPLEARTMGMYAGFLITFGYLLVLRRGRAVRFPGKWMTALLVGFVAVMGLDGLNSSAFEVGMVHLYAPSNTLRLITGLLAGTAMGSFLLPLASPVLRAGNPPRAVLGNVMEVAGLLVIESRLFFGIVSGAGWLLYPVSLIGAGGVVVLFFTISVAFIALLARKWSETSGRRDLLLYVDLALLLTVVELGMLLAFKLWMHQCPIQA